MIRIETDFSHWEGTNGYCSEESAARIRRAVAQLPLNAFHLIGTGDFHYQTLFWLERIREPFVLVLFDHHPDDQPAAFGADLISCGGWVAQARRLPACRGDLWIREAADFPALDDLPELPLYLSVDLDVLGTDWARTDWDQGTMDLAGLTGALRKLRGRRRIIGVDLCGGLPAEKGSSPDDLALNASAGEALFECFCDRIA